MSTRGNTFAEILRACPYSPIDSLDGLLSQEEFIQHYFHSDTLYEQRLEELRDVLLSPLDRQEIIVVHGFAGVGKTTFLHQFMARYEELCEFQYLDFQKIIAAEQMKAPISLMLLQMIYAQDSVHRDKALFAIKANTQRLRGIFSHRCLDLVEATAETDLDWKSIFENSTQRSFNDLFLFYLLTMFIKPSKKRLEVLCFDNLDVVSLEFINREFLREFSNAYLAAARMSQVETLVSDNPLFTNRYRFIFCLRDGNFAFFSNHLHDMLEPRMKAINFEMHFDGAFYRQIIGRRLEVAMAQLDERDTLSVIGSIMAQLAGRETFDAIFVNLFNCDYRKLVMALYQTAKKGKRMAWISETDPLSQYGATGTLIRAMANHLANAGYLDEYFDALDTFRFDVKRRGICHPYRMLLNLVLNHADKSNATLMQAPYKLNETCGLRKLVDEMAHCYSYETTLRSIARLFLYHEKSWVQLVTVYGFPIEDEKDLVEALLDNNLRGPEPGSVDASDPEKREAHELLYIMLEDMSARVKINPAGVVYLKHIQSHFEFYSTIHSYQHNGGLNGESLFEVGLSCLEHLSESRGDSKFHERCMAQVDGVFVWAKRHHRWMGRFFKWYFEDRMKMEPSDFRRSEYSFKYTGSLKDHYGMFHSTRTLTSHIDYLEKFRRFMLRRISDNPEAIVAFNKALLPRISKYVELLETSYDDSAVEFAREFRECISQIRESGYQDTVIPIRRA